MGNPYLANAGQFLLSVCFGTYILIVMLRLLLQMVRADFYNPLSQFIVKATQPVLRPLRRRLPALGGMDTATVVLLVGLQVLELALSLALLGQRFNIAGLLLLAVIKLLSLALNVFLFAIIIQVVISWVSPGTYNPLTSILYSLTEPLLAPARRLIPPFSGLDLSPLVVLIALQLASMLLLAPLRDLALGLMY